jgi:hypothetical protein
MTEEAVRDAITMQALYCERSGSPATAWVLRALLEVVDRSTETGRRILDWPGDPRGSGDALPLRIAGGLNALARRGDAGLAAIYAGRIDDPEVVRAALIAQDAELAGWLESPPQTNETGRSAAIMAGLLVLAAEHGLPFELIELGASAGLNLNLDRFSYRLGDTEAGDPESRLRLVPDWEGTSPPSARVRVVSRRAVDQAPVDVRNPAQRDRLRAYVWPDQAERVERLEAALAIAAIHPPLLSPGDAADFVEAELAVEQIEGVMRAVYHTVFWTYLPPATQARIVTALADAGSRATAQRPLAWLRYELNGMGGVAELHLDVWPGGVARTIAIGHPHVTSLKWLS